MRARSARSSSSPRSSTTETCDKGMAMVSESAQNLRRNLREITEQQNLSLPVREYLESYFADVELSDAIDASPEELLGAALQLTRYEYRLLKLLIDHPEQVFSRQQLMDHIWEHPEHSLERTVDTHIKGLRQKLKQVSAAQDPIVTHRGFGYSLKRLD